ncbi:MAG TPA: hypothetical protein ENJ52_07115 [Aliiroseovarius sp.]|nr:hypothetical protein [Aliiroseovarius sp.]
MRARMGPAGKALIALVLIGAVVLMVKGFKAADPVPVHTPLPGMGHLNNLLMLLAFYLLNMGYTKPLMARRIRHPMLSAVVVWAVAHLIVNGDLASVVLFGSMLLWALVEMAVINRAEGPWLNRPKGSARGEVINIALALALFGAVAWYHAYSGHNPFLGTYP